MHLILHLGATSICARSQYTYLKFNSLFLSLSPHSHYISLFRGHSPLLVHELSCSFSLLPATPHHSLLRPDAFSPSAPFSSATLRLLMSLALSHSYLIPPAPRYFSIFLDSVSFLYVFHSISPSPLTLSLSLSLSLSKVSVDAVASASAIFWQVLICFHSSE